MGETKGKGARAVFQRAYVEITNVCNLRCDFCPGTTRPASFMTPEDFRCIAEKLRPYTEYLYLHVMGEPLLHPALGEILAVCGACGFRVCLTTNGVLLQEKLELLRSCGALHKVSVSLHSFEGNHRREGLADYVSGCLASCRTLSRQGVLCALRLWNRGGAERLNGEIESLLGALTGQDMAALPADRRGNRRLEERLFLESAEKFDWPGTDGAAAPAAQFCYGLRQQLAVLCDGTAVPCCLDGQGALALGNLLTQELEEILQTPRAQAIRQGFERRRPAEELCRRCGYAKRFNR